MEYRYDTFKILAADRLRPAGSPCLFSEADAVAALRFHQTLPVYAPSELVLLKDLAAQYGIRGIFCKDESSRFGLNAFKGLGGSYAMFRILCDRFGLDPDLTGFEDLQTEELRAECAGIHFITATDGNHGKGVSWAAGLFGCPATVYMPAGTVEARRKAIEDAGNATAEITGFNYDRTVALARDTAEKNDWILIQDTAWDGYEKIPKQIIDGYLTLALEALDQLGGEYPTHIFLQAGVGSMAGGILDFFRHHDPERPPAGVIVEPAEADCIYRSALAGDGEMHSVEGDPVTIMAGLNCQTPCKTVWPILRDQASFYCACADTVTERGMRTYAHPAGNDPAVVSGESGAVTLGIVLEILDRPDLRELFGITPDSVILLISTEGDTDPEDYRRVVK